MEGLDITIAIRIGPDSKTYGPVVDINIISEEGFQMLDESGLNDLIAQ